MKISVFGLGYVGSVSLACLSERGHKVIGVDVSDTKVDLINKGKSPIIEEKIGDIIKKGIKKKNLSATTDYKKAINSSEISFICVGTHSRSNGSPSTEHINDVCRNIGEALKEKEEYHLVVMRSTVLPGTTRELVMPALEKYSGKKAGREFGVCFNPEFMREGTSVYDFYNPPKTIIGAMDKKSSELLTSLYKEFPGNIMQTTLEVSEMVKYADNSFHAVKITFANEIGMLCKKMGIDSHEVMNIFCKDTKLNISPAYLKPGFAFGGSCLPKDIRAILYKAKEENLELALLESLLLSNQKQIKRVINKIIKTGKKKIGFLGFSFKAGTDDLRESPIIEVIEALLGKGYKIKIYDKNVNIARLVGANKKFIEKSIPHIAKLMSKSIKSVIKSSELIVIGNKGEGFKEALRSAPGEKMIMDLVRLEQDRVTDGNYNGIAW